MSAAPLLSVQDLKVHFDVTRKGLFGGPSAVVRAVDGVTFDLRPGETLGLVGESGCGKSTLGRAVLRLLPATAGRVVWLGEDLHALEHAEMQRKRRDMQIIFQ
ncbi:MAG TPA: ATP-binding cassette domain-containing protein, partial [Dongiaceae bacterium]